MNIICIATGIIGITTGILFYRSSFNKEVSKEALTTDNRVLSIMMVVICLRYMLEGFGIK